MSILLRILTHFMPLVSFLPPKSIRCFHVMFSEVVKRERSHDVGYRVYCDVGQRNGLAKESRGKKWVKQNNIE